jgi:MtaA/CmuA family methyltransferase
MNGYERMVAALKGQPVDKIPVMLHNFMVAARELNVTMKQFRDNPRVIADAFIKSVEKYDLDGVLIDVDTVTLAGSLGVPVDFPDDLPARSHKGCLDSLDDIKYLKHVNIENYKYIQIWLESVRLVKEYFGNTILIRGNCDQSPFSLAGLVRGSELWLTDLYMAESAMIHELLEYCTDATCQFIRLMAQTGAHMLSNGDSLAGPDLIAPEMYEMYALPYEIKVVEEAHKKGLFYTLHICGDTGLILDKMLKTSADAFENDSKTDVYKAYEILHDKVTFIGNVDPSGVLANGSPELVRSITLELLDIFSKTRYFILNSGCALPSHTPEINLRTFVETARNYEI